MRQLTVPMACCILAISLAAAANSSLTSEVIHDLFSDDLALTSSLNVHRLDPTGRLVAWLEGGDRVSVFDVATGEARAVPLPEFMRPVTEFEWSPDGQRIAMTENAFLYLYEPDVWVLDLDSSATADCTNDLDFGSILDDSTDPWIDLFPTWLSADSVAFIRPSGDGPYGSAEVRVLSPTGCSVIDERADSASTRILWPLPDGFPSAFRIFRSPVWSPDGRRVAVVTQDLTFDGTTNGIWILDALTGATEQFVPTPEFSIGFPAWYDTTSIVPQDVTWIEGSAHLLAFVEDMSSTAGWPRMNLFLVDAETGVIEPVATYADALTRLDLFEEGVDGHTGVYDVPLQAVILPNDAGFLTLHQEIDPARSDAADVEIRRHVIEDGRAVLRDRETFTAAPRARGRGPTIVRMCENGVALVLNRYLIAFDTNLFDRDAPAD